MSKYPDVSPGGYVNRVGVYILVTRLYGPDRLGQIWESVLYDPRDERGPRYVLTTPAGLHCAGYERLN